MGELTGVARTIDHAVYMILNSVAIILWRLNSAIMSISMFGYQVQDWLTGRADGGIWTVYDYVVGPGGLIGISTWSAFFALALTLWGFTRLIRPFWRTQAVDVGRLFFFAVMSYTVITEGSGLLREVEAWRSEAGGYMYEILSAGGDSVDLDIPGGATSDEPVYNPEDLDGRQPIRGWEAVATSYFLATSANDLHDGVPPSDFRLEYCLYDPREPIDEQDQENDEGCSPRNAWDEHDIVSTQTITQFWGISLPINIPISVPVVQEHPEERELALRQAQEGVARLALGPIVALYPLLEAVISLLLALSASFIYLSLPLTLLFAFFMYTEPLTTRLFFQMINIMVRTLILNGILALFLMLLMSITVNGSLMAYLGVIGVGLVGGFFLIFIAMATMKESVAQSVGSVSNIWKGTLGGQNLGTQEAWEAAQFAQALAKREGYERLAAAVGSAVGAGGTQYLLNRLRASSAFAGQGTTGGAPAFQAGGNQLAPSTAQLPAPVARLAQTDSFTNSQSEGTSFAPPTGFAPPVPATNGRVGGDLTSRYEPAETMGFTQGEVAERSPEIAQDREEQRSAGVYLGNNPDVDAWVQQTFQAKAPGGQAQAPEIGEQLLGQELAKETREVISRHSEAEVMSALQATRQVAAEARNQSLQQPDGGLSQETIQQVHERLDGEAARAFSGLRGEQDLRILAAAALQPQKRSEPEEFRKAAAEADEWDGDRAAGREVPRELGLDATAAGAHFAALNRFTRLSEQAGLDPEKRQELLDAVKQEGEVPSKLRQEIESSIRQRQEQGWASNLMADDVIESARALPDTLEGPVLMRLKVETSAAETASKFLREQAAAGPTGAVPGSKQELQRAIKEEVRALRSDGTESSSAKKGEPDTMELPGDQVARLGETLESGDGPGAQATKSNIWTEEARIKSATSRGKKTEPLSWVEQEGIPDDSSVRIHDESSQVLAKIKAGALAAGVSSAGSNSSFAAGEMMDNMLGRLKQEGQIYADHFRWEWDVYGNRLKQEGQFYADTVKAISEGAQSMIGKGTETALNLSDVPDWEKVEDVTMFASMLFPTRAVTGAVQVVDKATALASSGVDSLGRGEDVGEVTVEKRTPFGSAEEKVLIQRSNLTGAINQADTISSRVLTGANVASSDGVVFKTGGKSWHSGTVTMDLPGGERTLTHLQSMNALSSEYFFDRDLDHETSAGIATGQIKAEDVDGFAGRVSRMEQLCPGWAITKKNLIRARIYLGSSGNQTQGGSQEPE